jgi:hypothetical protein
MHSRLASLVLAVSLVFIPLSAAGQTRPTRGPADATRISVDGDPGLRQHGHRPTSCEMDLQIGGQTRSERGRATEAFVLKNGQWLNTGWQLAPSAKQPLGTARTGWPTYSRAPSVPGIDRRARPESVVQMISTG